MKRYLLLAAALSFFSSLTFFAGCTYISVQSHKYLGLEKFPPTDPSGIEILHAPPKRPHEKIGEITLTPQGNPSTGDLELKLRQEAAKMGADAVVIVSDSTRLMGQYMSGPWWDGQIYPEWGRVIVGVAIRYTQVNEQSRPKTDKRDKPGKTIYKSATV